MTCNAPLPWSSEYEEYLRDESRRRGSVKSISFSEVMPEEAAPYVRIMATGRSDYPNQINNVLCFPGLFRGLLDSGSTKVTQEMVVAATHAIADCVKPEELSEDFIIPSVFNEEVAPAVAAAVAKVSVEAGLTRK